MKQTARPRPRAVLLGVALPGVSDAELQASLDELARLGRTLGFEIVGRVTQRRERLSRAAVVGQGKLRELAAHTGGSGVVPSGAPRAKRSGAPEEPAPEPEEREDEAADAAAPDAAARAELWDPLESTCRHASLSIL